MPLNYQLPWPVYTFLGAIILLVLFAGVKVAGIVILIRRRRRIVQEAIQNGTYFPPTPPNLTIKPELWEAYLGGSSSEWPLGRGEKGLDTNWKFEFSRNYWESIKPIYAGVAKPLTSAVRVPYSGSSPNLPTRLSPPPSIPVLTPINHSPPPMGDDEENQRTAEVSTTPPSLLTRARIFLHLNSSVPASSSTNNIGANSHPISAISPPQPMIRVIVLIAMPSPTPSHVSTTIPLSTSASSSLSSKKSQPTTTSELSSSPTTTLRFTDDEDQPLPHLEMGVADVVVVRSRTTSRDSSSWDSAHSTIASRREDRTSTRTCHSRGSSQSYAEPEP